MHPAFLHSAGLSTHELADGSCPIPAAISSGRTVAVCCRHPAQIDFDHHLIRQGIYKIIVPQYPAVSQILPFCSVYMVKQGIYRKIVCQYPADCKKGDMERQFFCIYPDMRKKNCFSPPWGLRAGYWGAIFLYIPRPLSGTKYSAYVREKKVISGNTHEKRIHQNFRSGL